MRSLRGMSPAELDRYTTAWLAEHDTQPARQPVDKSAPVEWSLSPVSAEVDCDDEDAAEIAATFASLSGGRLVCALVAHCTDEYSRGVLTRREYMRAARRDEAKRARWRAAERERRRAAAEYERTMREIAEWRARVRAAEHQRCRGSRRRRTHDPRQMTLGIAA